MTGSKTVDDNYGASQKFVQMKIVADNSVTKTADKLEEGPSKVRPLWYVKEVTE